MNQDLM